MLLDLYLWSKCNGKYGENFRFATLDESVHLKFMQRLFSSSPTRSTPVRQPALEAQLIEPEVGDGDMANLNTKNCQTSVWGVCSVFANSRKPYRRMMKCRSR
jgi:hypothetical protein